MLTEFNKFNRMNRMNKMIKMNKMNKMNRMNKMNKMNKMNRMNKDNTIKRLLIWNCFPDEPIPVEADLPDNWQITTDRALFQSATAVLFHLPTLSDNLWEYISYKESGQIWIAWSRESGHNFLWVDNSEFAWLFDLTMGYRQTDDILYPYYKYGYSGLFADKQDRKTDRNNVCMLISSPLGKTGRFEYLMDLMQYLSIDSYGKWQRNKVLEHDEGRLSKLDLYRKYKFVIAFENVIEDDYVTEKFFDPLLVGSVPVYLGAANIQEFQPGGNCFLDVRNFSSPKELADFIKKCCADDELYESFHHWRQDALLPGFVQKTEMQKINPFVRVCLKVDEYNARKEKLGKLYICAFADSCFQKSLDRLVWQSSMFLLFEEGFFYNETDLQEELFSPFGDMLKAGVRGYGYWVWKPYIILDALKQIEEGDILLYLDVGCHLNSRGKMRFLDYCETVKQHSSGFLVTNAGRNQLERIWTKGDLFDFMNVRDRMDITDTSQLQSGTIFIRKEPNTVALIEKWMEIGLKHFNLLDDSPSQSIDMDGFQGHRHDQSILSILLKLHGVYAIPLRECWSKDWTMLEKSFPILQKRDLQ